MQLTAVSLIAISNQAHISYFIKDQLNQIVFHIGFVMKLYTTIGDISKAIYLFPFIFCFHQHSISSKDNYQLIVSITISENDTFEALSSLKPVGIDGIGPNYK